MPNIGVNTAPAATFYPSFGGPTLGQVGTAPAATDTAPVNAAAKGEVATAAAVGSMGNPVIWWVVIILMLFALMFVAKRWGSEASDFASIKLSAYNIVVISLASAIGIVFFKTTFTRFKVPGLTTFWQAV